jgi:voltage-gated potassium channel Kch
VTPRDRWARLAAWWSAYQWLFVAGAALVTFALAFVGTSTDPSLSVPARLLRVFSAFGFGYPLLAGSEHQAAVAARWLAVLVTLFTLAKVWSALFRDQLQLLRTRWTSNHAVVCGLGDAGTAIASALRAGGIPVIGVERGAIRDAATLRSKRIAMLVGDACEPMTLRLARVDRARFLVTLCGNDETNAEILSAARRVVGRRAQGPLTCVVHVSDLGLRRLMRSAEFAAAADDPIRLQCVNLQEVAARALLTEHPLPAHGSWGGAPHALLVGLGRFGESMLLELARRWTSPAGGGRIRVSVIDPQATARTRDLVARQKALDARCEIVAVDATTRSAEFESGALLRAIEAQSPIDAAYVCLGDGAAAVAAALVLQARATGRNLSIAIRTLRELGLPDLLSAVTSASDARIRLFPLLPRTCTAELVRRGSIERIAEALHEAYREGVRATESRRAPELLAPWEDLSDGLREDSRQRADQISTLLRDAGLRFAPLDDWDAPPVSLSGELVERIASLEHARWVAQRTREGWRVGAQRDSARKINPFLVDWKELPEIERERMRAEMNALPAQLARIAELTLVRVSSREDGNR